MKTLFVSCDLWELVENGFVDLADSEEVPRLTVAQAEREEKERCQSLVYDSAGFG